MKNVAGHVSLLHTAEVHVKTFTRLFRQRDDEVPLRHFVEPEHLEQAQRAGEPTHQILERAADRMTSLARDGAAVVLCTCSTIGEAVDRAQSRCEATVMRVDQPMARLAVQSGQRIAVAVCVETSAAPTVRLLERVASECEREISIEMYLMTEAWSLFERGELAEYHAEVAKGLIRAARSADVVVIGQASMAPAVDLCGETSAPLLSSPELGVAAAVVAWREKRDSAGA